MNCRPDLLLNIGFSGTKGDGLGPPSGSWGIGGGYITVGPITGGAYSNTNFNINGEVGLSSAPPCTLEGTPNFLPPGTQVLIRGDCSSGMETTQIFFKANNGVEGSFVGFVSCAVF